MEAGFGRHPDAEIYLSQPGLGTVLGARVLAEFGDDPTRYADARARKNYSGMAPITRASGTKRVVLARYARNRRLADALYQQAFAALTASPGARAYYDRHRARGATHHQALRALANRLVGILHGCLRHHSRYDETTAWATPSRPTPSPLDGLRPWDVYKRATVTGLAAEARVHGPARRASTPRPATPARRYLGDMSRVEKTDPRLVAYADVDETNSVIGVALALAVPEPRWPTCCAASRTTSSTSAPISAPRRPPDLEFPPLRITPGLHGAARGGLRRVQRAAAQADQLHPPWGAPRRRAPPPGPGGGPARRAERLGARGRLNADRTNVETARYLNRLSDLLFILARTACNLVATSCGSPARTLPRSRRPLIRLRPAGRDSTQERKPVTVELSIASSRDPSAVLTSAPRRRRAERRLPGRARAGTHLQLGPASRSCGRTESDSPRYQSSMSPPYQATPTDQRGDPTGRSHMVTAPSPESRNRRRSRKAPRRRRRAPRAGPAEPWSRALRDAGGRVSGWLRRSRRPRGAATGRGGRRRGPPARRSPPRG